MVGDVLIGLQPLLWLVLNDVTIGVIFGSYLCDNHEGLAWTLDTFVKEFLIGWVQWMVGWLNSWPAGLKLNTELSQFYSDIFMSIIAFWGDVLNRTTAYYPSLIYFTGILGCGGMSMALSFLSDILAVVTAHLYLCYLIATLIYSQMLGTAGSLWNLFRGKHYNVLRHRTDSWQYDIDQLLFGTMIFTLLAFLFPTVLVYYLLFAATRLSTILAHGILQTLLALTILSHSPHSPTPPFSSPAFPPRDGDVYFVVHQLESETSDSPGKPCLVSKNQTTDMRYLLYQYRPLWTRVVEHYHPGMLARKVLLGRCVDGM